MAAGGASLGTYALDYRVCPGNVFQFESHLSYQYDRCVRSSYPIYHTDPSARRLESDIRTLTLLHPYQLLMFLVMA